MRTARTMKKIIVHVDAELQDIVPLFLENRRADVAKLTHAVQTGALTEVYSIAHNLAGTGAGYGFEEISRIGRAMCDALKINHLDALPALISRLQAYLDAVEVVYKPSE